MRYVGKLVLAVVGVFVATVTAVNVVMELLERRDDRLGEVEL